MSNIPCFLIPALVGLISGILGYLLGKMSCKDNKNEWKSDLEDCFNKNLSLKAELDKLKASVSSTANNFVGGDNKSSNLTASAASLIIFDGDAAKAIFGKSIKENDLKIVEGIGPKIEELFNASGILTWKRLGETSVDTLKEILNKGGERFQIHDPSTWPKQSMLAYEGNWQELKNWQDTLDGGKE